MFAFIASNWESLHSWGAASEWLLWGTAGPTAGAALSIPAWLPGGGLCPVPLPSRSRPSIPGRACFLLSSTPVSQHSEAVSYFVLPFFQSLRKSRFVASFDGFLNQGRPRSPPCTDKETGGSGGAAPCLSLHGGCRAPRLRVAPLLLPRLTSLDCGHGAVPLRAQGA